MTKIAKNTGVQALKSRNIQVRRAVRVRRAGLPGGLRDLRPPPAAYAGADAAADRGPLGGADAAADGRADQRSDAGASRPTRAGGYL